MYKILIIVIVLCSLAVTLSVYGPDEQNKQVEINRIYK